MTEEINASSHALMIMNIPINPSVNGEIFVGKVWMPGEPYPGPPPTGSPDDPEVAPPPEGDDRNHFNDWLDNKWGFSIKNPDNMFFSNKHLSHAAGAQETVSIPNDPSLIGNPLVMGCGGPAALGDVRVKLGSDTLTKQFVSNPGSLQLTISEAMIGQSLTYKFIDGHDQSAIQFSLLT